MIEQADDLTPAMEGRTLSIALDTTARTYDLSTVDLGSEGDLVGQGQEAGQLYLRLVCNGDYFYMFSNNASATISKTQAVAAAGALAMPVNVPDLNPSLFVEHVRINRKRHRYLTVLADSGTPILRIRPSSATQGALDKP